MTDPWTIDPTWWATAVELPALAGLFWLNHRTKRDADAALATQQRRANGALMEIRDALAAYKLEVAQSYASLSHLKEVEERLTAHLLRIEAKLDARPARRSGERP